MLKNNYKWLLPFLKRPLLASFILISAYFDQALAGGGVGDLADGMLEPVSLFSKFVNAGCLILGSSFLFASVVKYFEHRRSPLMVPISTVVFLFVGSIVLLAIPAFSYFYTKKFGISIR